METFSKIVEGTKSGWNSMDRKKKIIMVGLVVGIILIALSLSYFSRQVTYATLFTNLEPEDAGTIVEDLKSKNMKYKLENGGRDILIDEKHVDSYRLQLAMEGNMPEKSSGFEIFDNMGLMVTDEDRKIMYQRALAGELQRSIMSLDAVNYAKVHLVMSEKSIFETEEKEASASVFLDLNPGKKITDNMIRGIAALVSGAVDNLPEENIKIIDSKGNLLSNILEEGDDLGAINALDQYQKARESFQEKMESSLYEILGAALGRDKVKVSVYADLDFDAEETTTITYSDPVVRSEQITGDGTAIDNLTGAGNIGDGSSNVVGTEDDLGVIYDRIVNHELSSETTTTIKAPGKINRLTTSVIYDGELSPEASDQILSIVAAATGYDTDRGDFISIEGMPFDRSLEEEIQKELDELREQEEGKTIWERYRSHITLGLISTIGAIIVMAIIRFIASRRREEEAIEEEFPLYVPMEDMMEDATEVVEKLEVKEDPKETKAKEFAEENPDVVADLIRAWIKD